MFHERNKEKKRALKGAATIAKKSAFIFGDLYCSWWDYQPKKPMAVKKQTKS